MGTLCVFVTLKTVAIQPVFVKLMNFMSKSINIFIAPGTVFLHIFFLIFLFTELPWTLPVVLTVNLNLHTCHMNDTIGDLVQLLRGLKTMKNPYDALVSHLHHLYLPLCVEIKFTTPCRLQHDSWKKKKLYMNIFSPLVDLWPTYFMWSTHRFAHILLVSTHKGSCKTGFRLEFLYVSRTARVCEQDSRFLQWKLV